MSAKCRKATFHCWLEPTPIERCKSIAETFAVREQSYGSIRLTRPLCRHRSAPYHSDSPRGASRRGSARSGRAAGESDQPIISRCAIVVYARAPQLVRHWQARTCPRAAQKSATYRSLRSRTGSSGAVGQRNSIQLDYFGVATSQALALRARMREHQINSAHYTIVLRSSVLMPKRGPPRVSSSSPTPRSRKISTHLCDRNKLCQSNIG
jgi:hypothetical protein